MKFPKAAWTLQFFRLPCPYLSEINISSLSLPCIKSYFKKITATLPNKQAISLSVVFASILSFYINFQFPFLTLHNPFLFTRATETRFPSSL